jgi:hypothetical protein
MNPPAMNVAMRFFTASKSSDSQMPPLVNTHSLAYERCWIAGASGLVNCGRRESLAQLRRLPEEHRMRDEYLNYMRSALGPEGREPGYPAWSTRLP